MAGIPDIVWAIGIVALLTTIFFAGAIASKAKWAKMSFNVLGWGVVATAAYFASVIFFPEWTDPRYRSFKSLFHEVEVGMTEDQVMAKVDKIYPSNGIRKRPILINEAKDRLMFHMDPEYSKDPNCEGILINLSGGKVVSKYYSAD